MTVTGLTLLLVDLEVRLVDLVRVNHACILCEKLAACLSDSRFCPLDSLAFLRSPFLFLCRFLSKYESTTITSRFTQQVYMAT